MPGLKLDIPVRKSTNGFGVLASAALLPGVTFAGSRRGGVGGGRGMIGVDSECQRRSDHNQRPPLRWPVSYHNVCPLPLPPLAVLTHPSVGCHSLRLRSAEAAKFRVRFSGPGLWYETLQEAIRRTVSKCLTESRCLRQVSRSGLLKVS